MTRDSCKAGTNLVTMAVLRSHCWTDGAVRRFLSAPDRLVPNPMYRSGSPMRLWDANRVETVEASPE